MEAYHGLPLGGSMEQVDLPAFLSGRCAFVSFSEPSQVAHAAAFCSRFALDNGAFSHWKQGRKFTPDLVKRYGEFVRTWHRHPAFAFAVAPDAIGRSEAVNEKLLDLWAAEGVCDWAPTWHLGESLDWLITLICRHRRICIGGLAAWRPRGREAVWRELTRAFDVICDDDGRPRVRVHGLQMLSGEFTSRLPLASADSTDSVRNARSPSRFGTYTPPTGAQRAAAIARCIEARPCAERFVRESFDLAPQAVGDVAAPTLFDEASS